MARVSELILNCLLNSLWQIPAIWAVAGLGAFLLKRCTAGYRHTIWIVALVLSVVIPVTSVIPIVPAGAVALDSAIVESSSPFPVVAPTVNAADDITSPLERGRTRNHPVVVTATPRILQLLTFAYALFIAFGVIRLVRMWLLKERLRKTAAMTAITPQIEAAAKCCGRILQLSNVTIVHSNTARVPYTLGWRRPLVVLPDSFCADVSDETLLSVIAHEMAHVRRLDYVTKLICEVLSLPIAFHPITFLIKRQIDRERELACDQLVTQLVLMPETYARSLLRAAALSLLPAPNAVMLSIFDGRILEKRIMQLTRNSLLRRRGAGRAITASVVFGLFVSALALSAFAFELRTEDVPQLSPTTAALSIEEKVVAESSVQNPVQRQIDLKSSDPQEKVEAACAAARKRDLEAIPALIAMLGDDSKTELVICWGGGRWSPALETFKHASPGEQAALALASMGRPAFMPLANQLDNPNPTVRRNAAWAIGELTNMLPDERSSSGPQLISLLSDADVWVRMAAARAIGELRELRATETLTVTLNDADWRVRQFTTWALSEMKDERAVKALCDVLLSDPRAEVRRGAAEALGEIRSAEALPSLRQAVHDPEVSVGTKASWAIAEIENSDG